MAGAKSLAKDSITYGSASIISKMVATILTPVFTYSLTKAEFGIITNLYAFTALFLVVLTFGLETGLFRFITSAENKEKNTVYSTVILIIGGVVLCYLGIFLGFFDYVRGIWERDIPDQYILLIIIIIAMDVFSAIPFAYLRYKKRPIKFGFLKILNTVLYVILCVFFLYICPWIYGKNPEWVSWFFNPEDKVQYVFISNLIATAIQTACLLPEITGFRYRFDPKLAKKLVSYCFPLMLMGLAGMSNQVVDKIVFPAVYPGGDGMAQLGLYSGCFKISLIMMMFTQAFRYAYEPFVFEKSKDDDAKESYGKIMKYFVLLALGVFLFTTCYIDIFKWYVGPEYFEALGIVPIVLLGELFFAVYFNLSIWYKLTDRTYWGTIFSAIGFVIIIVLNILLIPKYSYWACAWAAFAGNFAIMLLSYFVGQKKYPIRYDLKTLSLYTGLALLLFGLSQIVPIENLYFRLGFRTILISIYILFMIKRDLPLKEISVLNRFLK